MNTGDEVEHLVPLDTWLHGNARLAVETRWRGKNKRCKVRE